MMKPVLLMAALASVLAAAIPSAQAGSLTKQFQVTAEIAPFCSVSTFDLDFGTYTTVNVNGGVALDAFSFIYVICPDQVAYQVALDEGLNSAEAGVACDAGMPAPSRNMESTTPPNFGSLPYTLYSDEARTIPWGCSPESDLEGVGNGATFTEHRVYGRIDAGMVSLADTYADTVTVTVTF
jgi:spore coat protein U-like protein